MSGQTYIYALHDPRDWSIRYVGKANNPASRLKIHAGKDAYAGMRTFIKELSLSGLSPSISILQICSQSQWPFWEKFWIATARASGADLLNRASGGNAPPTINEARRGQRLSLEHREKISIALKGKAKTPEAVAKTNAAHRGAKRSLESRARMSATHRGKRSPRSAEARENIRTGLIGRKHSPERVATNSLVHKGQANSPEQRAKISASLKGRIKSPEHLAKIGLAHRGKEISPEHRAKVGAAHKGMKHSPETRAKISAALKGKKKRPRSPEHIAKPLL
jgi:hypothetical protein